MEVRSPMWHRLRFTGGHAHAGAAPCNATADEMSDGLSNCSLSALWHLSGRPGRQHRVSGQLASALACTKARTGMQLGGVSSAGPRQPGPTH
jgi:hypothetical protein